MSVLLVEDSKGPQPTLGIVLRDNGFVVDIASNRPAACDLARRGNYQVVVVNEAFPGRAGLAALRDLRAAGVTAHILLLSERSSVGERVEGLTSGADDYLVKPYAVEELVARIHALARRSQGANSSHLRLGELLIDISARQAIRDDRKIDLTAREYALLEFLALRHDTIVPREALESHIYGINAGIKSNVIDAIVYSLRKTLDPPTHVGLSIIHTRRGMGYELRTN